MLPEICNKIGFSRNAWPRFKDGPSNKALTGVVIGVLVIGFRGSGSGAVTVLPGRRGTWHLPRPITIRERFSPASSSMVGFPRL